MQRISRNKLVATDKPLLCDPILIGEVLLHTIFDADPAPAGETFFTMVLQAACLKAAGTFQASLSWPDNSHYLARGS